MADPFDRLRAGSTPADPPEAFAAELRHRYLAALGGDPVALTGRSDPAGDGPAEQKVTPTMIDLEVPAPRRWRRIALAAATVAAATALVVVVVNGGGDDGTVKVTDTPVSVSDPSTVTTATAPTTNAGSTVTATSPSKLPQIQELSAVGATELDVDRNPTFLTAVDGSVWTTHQFGPLVRRDATTGQLENVVPSLTNGAFVYPPVEGFGSLWITTYLDGVLWRVDPQSGDVIAKIAIPGGLDLGPGTSPSGPAIDASGVWTIAAGSTRSLVHVDATSNSVDRTLALPYPLQSCCVWSVAGELWVETTDDRISRIDPVDGTVLAEIPTAASAGVLVADATDAWVPAVGSGGELELRRIDIATSAIVARVTVSDASQDGDGRQIALGGGFVWATSPDATLVKIDPATNTVVARYGSEPGVGVAVAGDAVWVTVNGSGRAYRLPLD